MANADAKQVSRQPVSPKSTRRAKQFTEIGWCELVDIPSLGLEKLHAKMDSGAATSSIHATRIRPIEKDGAEWVEFWFRPKAGDKPRRMEAPVLEKRKVTSSNGQVQMRYVIAVQLCLGNLCWNGQMTLANRRSMAFPVLVGRRALKRGFLVNSAKRWMLGRPVRVPDPKTSEGKSL